MTKEWFLGRVQFDQNLPKFWYNIEWNKVSENPFRKFRSTSRGCPFVQEIRKFRKLCFIWHFYTALVPLVVTVVIVDHSGGAAKHSSLFCVCLHVWRFLGFFFLRHVLMMVSRETVFCTTLGNTLSTLPEVRSKRTNGICRSRRWFMISYPLHENARIYFSGAMTGRPDEFPVGICSVCIISRERSSQVFLVEQKWRLNWLGKYLGILVNIHNRRIVIPNPPF